jgi:hypothetical protein
MSEKRAANFTAWSTEPNPGWRSAAQQFLRDIDRHDLAALLERADCVIGYEEVWFNSSVPAALLSAPGAFALALRALPDHDSRRVCEAISATDSRVPSDQPISGLIVVEGGEPLTPSESLLPDLVLERAQMIAVATGEGRIQDVDDYYRARRKRIKRALAERGLEDLNPFASLWDWYHKWKEAFPTYAERRAYVMSIFKPALDALHRPSTSVPVQAREPTGWERVDRALEKAHARFEVAQHEEDFQTIGLLCREVLISLGAAVFDSDKHKTEDGVKPSPTDAKRMLDAFIAATAGGRSNETIRRHARAGLDLAVELQHHRNGNAKSAALCLEATSSTVNVVRILAQTVSC